MLLERSIDKPIRFPPASDGRWARPAGRDSAGSVRDPAPAGNGKEVDQGVKDKRLLVTKNRQSARPVLQGLQPVDLCVHLVPTAQKEDVDASPTISCATHGGFMFDGRTGHKRGTRCCEYCRFARSAARRLDDVVSVWRTQARPGRTVQIYCSCREADLCVCSFRQPLPLSSLPN